MVDQAGRVVGAGGQLRLHLVHPPPDGVVIDADPVDGDAEAAGIAGRVRSLRAGQQHLGRHAPGPQAVAPVAGPLDGGHPQAEGGCELGGGDPRRAEAEDHEVVAVGHPGRR